MWVGNKQAAIAKYTSTCFNNHNIIIYLAAMLLYEQIITNFKLLVSSMIYLTPTCTLLIFFTDQSIEATAKEAVHNRQKI